MQREAHIDVALWATVPPRGPITDVQALVDAGAAAFKLSTFETHPQRFPRIPDPQLRRRVRQDRSRSAGSQVCTPRTTRSSAPGSPPSGPQPAAPIHWRMPVRDRRSPSTRRSRGCLEFARATGVRLHVCHVSTLRGVALVNAARHDGLDVSAETCPHYLLLDESELLARGGEAKINPPLRAAPLPSDGLDLDLVRSRRLAAGAQTRARHLRARVRRPRRRADRAARPRRTRPPRAGSGW